MARPLPSFAFLLACSPAVAQWFSELPTEQMPRNRWTAQAVAVGDLDQDGDVDLVFVRPQDRLWLLRQGGLGRFTAEEPDLVAPQSFDAARLADLDSDGDLDLVMSRNSARPLFWRNDGATWTDVTATTIPSWEHLGGELWGLVPFDADGDGDLDLFVGGTHEAVLLRNLGSGTFALANQLLPPALVPFGAGMGDAHAVDLDGDGDLDLVASRRFATAQQRHFVLRNDGAIGFVDASAGLPAFGAGNLLGQRSMAVGDVDGDGDPDLVSGRAAGALLVYRNLGAGAFTAAPIDTSGLPIDPTTIDFERLRLGDLDGDGDLDLLLDDSLTRFVLRNDGSGQFTAGARAELAQGEIAGRDQVLADLDADGDLDLVTAMQRFGFTLPELGAPLLRNDGRGNFTNLAGPFGGEGHLTKAAVALDLDRDGLQDLLVAHNPLQANAPGLRPWRNRGDGSFERQPLVPYGASSGQPVALATADVDGDGWHDALLGTTNGNAILLRNQNGVLVPGGQLPAPGNDRIVSAAFVDVDGDGDPDLVTGRGSLDLFAPQPARTRLWRNDGQGVFTDVTASRMPALLDLPARIIALDVDTDHDLDLLLSEAPFATTNRRLYRNDGTGHFVDAAASRLPADASGMGNAVPGDWNGDGRTDLVVIGSGSMRTWLQTPAGTFVDATPTWTSPIIDGLDLFATDVDRDGRQDLVVATFRVQVLRNLPSQQWQVQSNPLQHPLLLQYNLEYGVGADFDGDGDLDLATATPLQNQLFWNLRRQLSLPLVASPGGDLRVRLQAEPGRLAAATLALVAYASGRGAVPSELGLLRFDPEQLIDLRTALLPAPTGRVDLTSPIPPWPSLQGHEITVQAVFFGAELQLSNALSTTIR